MDLTKDYEKLYNHWLAEFQNPELTNLTQDLFEDYKKIVAYINAYKEEKKDKLKEKLLKSYQDNFNYLLKDFMKIRKEKIMKSGLSLIEIDLDKTIEAEKLLYQNIVAALKGYKKVKDLTINEEEEKSEPLKSRDIEGDKRPEIKENSNSILTEMAIESDIVKKEINYLLVRILENTPALVGIDLKNYGPFQKEDIATLPVKNAKILIFEKFAEEIELT